ncbi:MAG TPA: cupin domain-containing protein [Stellaceae bacterium]|nr:cupin domain-containing protein [Stellaceae bacterium]
MGQVIDLATAEAQAAAGGARVAPLLGRPAAAEMAAALIRLSPGARFETTVPAGSDQYLFVLSGHARIGLDGGSAALAPDGWAIIEEGRRFGLEGGAAELLSIVVPPPGARRSTPGFRGGFKAVAAGDLPVVDLPAEKKQRIYLANKATAAGSERGHAMIVRYTGETLTKRHHHPNAESLFVILSGRVRFLIDGSERVLGRGEAAFFPIEDRHGLRSADGNPLHFLELHVPGAFETRYDE